MSQTIRIQADDGGSFDAYLALPQERPAPALIVVSSIYGVNRGLKQTIDRYARRGYIVVAPDIFWRTHPGPIESNQRSEAMARLNAYQIGPGMDDVRATRDALQQLPEWNGKFAIVGFCFGGQHAFLGLTRLDADAGVSYHGTSIENYLDEAPRVTKPFSFHFGSEDDLVPPAALEAIRTALAGKTGDIVVHDGAGHGFAREDSAGYVEAVAHASEEQAFIMLDALKTVAVV